MHEKLAKKPFAVRGWFPAVSCDMHRLEGSATTSTTGLGRPPLCQGVAPLATVTCKEARDCLSTQRHFVAQPLSKTSDRRKVLDVSKPFSHYEGWRLRRAVDALSNSSCTRGHGFAVAAPSAAGSAAPFPSGPYGKALKQCQKQKLLAGLNYNLQGLVCRSLPFSRCRAAAKCSLPSLAMQTPHLSECLMGHSSAEPCSIEFKKYARALALW